MNPLLRGMLTKCYLLCCYDVWPVARDEQSDPLFGRMGDKGVSGEKEQCGKVLGEALR